MNHSKREREILHNYLEELGKHYKNIEPAEAAGSMCKIYNNLAITNKFHFFCMFDYIYLQSLLE